MLVILAGVLESTSMGLLMTLQNLHSGSTVTCLSTSQGPQRAIEGMREWLVPLPGGLDQAPLVSQQASHDECYMVRAPAFHGGGCWDSHACLPLPGPTSLQSHARVPEQGVQMGVGRVPLAEHQDPEPHTSPHSVCPDWGPFEQSWKMPLSFLICAPASETRVLERIINTPFCGFWLILPIWGNHSHYALWSFLIKMTFPLSLKVEISA